MECETEFDNFVRGYYQYLFQSPEGRKLTNDQLLTTFVRTFSYRWGSKLRIQFLDHEGFGDILKLFHDYNCWTITTTRLTRSGHGSHTIRYDGCDMVDHSLNNSHDSTRIATFNIEFAVRGGFKVLDVINNIDE